MAVMTPTEFLGAVPVDGYGPGFFRVGGTVHRGAIIVTPEGVRPWGGLGDAAALLALAGSVDVLFLGMGAEIAFPPRALTQALEAAGVMAEPMNSPSAARSYNVTLAEGRRVACALIPL
ncbi:Mth938-like domain-containing protein [Paracoccus sp. N5]|uniref:Mth938-like domain-containing protein n=1 Tax=Paracoccus sp. N5 TaxID=1101189 RepID=UPI00036EAA7B|nr:Mth938-like domain-containing protein [Paracoccus sp. N5]